MLSYWFKKNCDEISKFYCRYLAPKIFSLIFITNLKNHYIAIHNEFVIYLMQFSYDKIQDIAQAILKQSFDIKPQSQ